MKSSLPLPTAEDERRFLRLYDLGCVACAQLRPPQWSATQIHHLLSGGRRISHQDTVPLCPWHHEGIPLGDYGTLVTAAMLGPSMAKQPRLFRERFGGDFDLLTMTNQKLTQMC